MGITVSQARGLRKRYADDEDYRERRKAYARAYYQRNKDSENTRVRKWMKSKQEFVCNHGSCVKPLFYNNKTGLCKKHWCAELGRRGKKK